MNVGDLVEVFYISDTGNLIVLTTGLVIYFGNHKTGEDLVYILKQDGEIENYSMNINQIKFSVISEK